MTARRRWLLVPLALMILFSTGLRSGAAIGNSSNQRGLMADLIRFYQIYDRMSDENWANFVKANRDEIAKKFTTPLGSKFMPGTVPSKVRKNMPGNIVDFSRRAGTAGQPEPFNHMFFDAGDQKKMGWSEDTYECLVSLQGDDAALQQAGARIISSLPYQGGRIARIAVAGKQLAAVAGLSVVRSMAPVMKREADNDLGSITTGAPRLRVGTAGNWDTDKGFTGQGVVVGMIDTGIDWSHADFSDPVNGGTRIQYIWNTSVTTSGKTPADLFGGDLSGLNWGTVWTKAEINGGTCTAYDTNGHGTHTSGTAAGNGGATGNYTGMAPNADIIMVQGLTNNGILFIYEMAKRLGKPCAVNMSYGPSYPVHYETVWPYDFPQDSTDLDGQWINALNQYYGGGNIPVKSAGNIGHWNTYTDLSGGGYPKKQGGYHWATHQRTKTSHVLNVPDYDVLWNNWWGYSPGYHDVPELYLGCWLERPANVLITDPYGHTYIFPFGEDHAYLTYDGNVISGEIDSTPEANGAYTGVFCIYPYYGYYGASGAAVQPTRGKWNFATAPKVGGKGHADFWVSDLNWYNGNEYFGVDWYTPEIYTTFAGLTSHSSYIVDEGATPFEITVGAWTTRTNWDSINGHNYTYTKKPILNTIADFSSPGPARNLFMKPDIAAPGQIILSALTHSASVNAAYVTTDGAHQAMSGTSMSAPFTTGGVALMLQKFPHLSLGQVRFNLKSWAKEDYLTRAIGPNGFGAGKLNLKPLKSTPVAKLTVDKKILDLSNKDIATFSADGSYDPDDLPFELKWVLVATPDGASCSFSHTLNGKTATLVPAPGKPGIYKVGLIVEGAINDSPMVVVTVQAVN